MLYDIESLCKQKIIIMLLIGFLNKLKYSTFDDPEGSRSRSLILLDMEYIASGAKSNMEFVSLK